MRQPFGIKILNGCRVVSPTGLRGTSGPRQPLATRNVRHQS